MDQLVPCRFLDVVGCLLNATLKALNTVLGLVNAVGLGAVTGAIVDQAQPQRTPYGSAIIADVTAIKAVGVYGASAVIPGTFMDLNPAG